MYEYRALIVRWIDADTVDVHIDLGFRQWMHDERLRLIGIDAPDKNPAKTTATNYVRKTWPAGTEILVETEKDSADKYGRWLAHIYVGKYNDPGGEVNINATLVTAGMAVPWDGLGGHPTQATGVAP